MGFVLFKDYLAVPVLGNPLFLPVVVITIASGNSLCSAGVCYKLVLASFCLTKTL